MGCLILTDYMPQLSTGPRMKATCGMRERLSTKCRPYGAEQELDWEITKNVTDFFQFGIAIRVHIWDLKEVEVQTEKGKKKLSQARVLIVMNGKLVTDWKRRFARGVFNKLLGKWYDKINYSKIGGYADTLAYRMLSLQAIIKKYFNMQTKKNVY